MKRGGIDPNRLIHIGLSVGLTRVESLMARPGFLMQLWYWQQISNGRTFNKKKNSSLF